jgi:hypothetical protein
MIRSAGKLCCSSSTGFPLICGKDLDGKCDADLSIKIWRERDAPARK